MSFYSESELDTINLKSYGTNVKISRYARFYNPEVIEVGNNVRIDDFCILSASLDKPFILRDYIHISAGVYLYGSSGIYIDSFSNISAGVKIYTVNDDYSGNSLIGPTVSEEYRTVEKGEVILEKYCVIGCNTVILPNVHVSEGVAIGCNSLVKHSLEKWSIYAGSPVKFIKQRSKNLLNHITFINTNVV